MFGHPVTKEALEAELKIQQENLERYKKDQQEYLKLYESRKSSGFKSLADSYSSSIIFCEDRIATIKLMLKRF